MRVVIFDTETTSVTKRFCYNIGYIIVDLESREILVNHDFVVEQIWHNIPLFSTAYYADKRPIYINAMRCRKMKMEKIGYITQKMIHEFKAYEVQAAFAYNSSFDDGVFQFNCDFFKIINPFDNIPIYDIRGYVHKYIAFTSKFQDFCEQYQLFTEGGNYSTTAEAIYQYITNNADFVEDHTALSDSLIEWEILANCIDKGAEVPYSYKTYASIPRKVARPFQIFHNKELVYQGDYVKKRIGKKKDDYRFYNE